MGEKVLKNFGPESDTPGAGSPVPEAEDRARVLNLLAAIVDSSDDAIVSKTLDGTITSWNNGAERLFGYTADEAIGKHITLIIPAERYPEEDRIIQNLRAGIRVDHFETVRVRKDGTRVEVSLTISPVRNSAGEVVGASKVARDITERKLAEERLRRTEKVAAAGQLAAALAHEINNPLSVVTNALYLLRQNRAVDERARSLIEIANAELGRMTRIVKQSLAYYRTGSVAKKVDIAAAVEESLEVFGPRLERKGIQLLKKTQSSCCVIGFPDEIRQAIDNLLVNAIEAMPAGGRLGVSLHNVHEWRNGNRHGARLTVADSGTGIENSIRNQIFEPFFTTKPEKGTGLGLWVVRGIVTKHEGTIRVRSSDSPGKSGTAISIFWPAVLETAGRAGVAEGDEVKEEAVS